MKWLRRWIAASRHKSQIALLRRADAARDGGRFGEAHDLYRAFLKVRPDRSDVRIQAGHMAKEARDYPAAERHYRDALAQRPDDPDLALQLGHLHKMIGRWDEAETWFARALALQPGWEAASGELQDLQALRPQANWDGLSDADARSLALALAPNTRDLEPRRDHERVILHRFGRLEAGQWGMRRTLSGLEAIRGLCGSVAVPNELEILLRGETIHREPIAPGRPFSEHQNDPRRRKYVFNAWVDFTPFPPGLYPVELRLIGEGRTMWRQQEIVAIGAPPREEDFPASDGIVTPDPSDPRGAEAQVRSRPSMIRAAERPLFPEGVRNLLVLRTDQIGDVVASIPALVRLRALFPGARIVGLLTEANADLARTLGLFDEVIVVDFPDDETARRRLMDVETQRALRARLAPYRFDIALDLAVSDVSRELLRLTGARFTHGTGGAEWPWLDSRLRFDTPDPRSGLDTAPHSARVLALVEALGAAANPAMPVLWRTDLSPDRLERFGLHAGARYAVLHMGARIDFTRWPGFPALARRLLEETDLSVVLMGHDPGRDPPLPPELLADERLVVLAERLPFDDFDALLSHAAVLVGNDSGPKHLASLRGTPAITLFSARIDWREWGQERGGAIISRRVPCAGCAIRHDPDECGKDVACIRDISVDEVFGTVRHYL